MHRCFIRREHAALSVIDRRRGRVDDDDNDFSYVRFRTLNRWATSRIYFTLSGVTSEALVRYSTNLDGLSFQRAWTLAFKTPKRALALAASVATQGSRVSRTGQVGREAWLMEQIWSESKIPSIQSRSLLLQKSHNYGRLASA
jgi:hypothetical protein